MWSFSQEGLGLVSLPQPPFGKRRENWLKLAWRLGKMCVESLSEAELICSRIEGYLALIGVLRCWFWCLQLCVVCCWESDSGFLLPPSAPLQSLCTAANTTLITLLSIGPFFTLKGKEVLSSFFPPLCHFFLSYTLFYNLLLFLCYMPTSNPSLEIVFRCLSICLF